MAPEDQNPNVIGNRYEVIDTIGRGGVGKVIKCRDRQLQRIVAVKILFDQKEEAVTRFHREAKISARLNHEAIVNVVDFGLTEDSKPYLAMEYLDGESLKDRIKRDGRINVLDFLSIAIDIASGLSYAHSQGVLHRDIKPSNIMLVKNERNRDSVKIVDFGIAKNISSLEQHLTTTGAIIGTPNFLSPESVEGRVTNIRSEIFSFGCLMFECLSGKPPYDEESTIMTMMARLEKPPPSLSEIENYSYPIEIETIVSKCLKRDPKERYANFGELKIDLKLVKEAIEDSENPPADRDLNIVTIGLTAIYNLKREKSKLTLMVAGSLVLFVVLALAFFSFKRNDEIESLPKIPNSDKASEITTIEDEIAKKVLFKIEKDKSGKVWIDMHAHKGSAKSIRHLYEKHPGVKFFKAQYDDFRGPEIKILNKFNFLGLHFNRCEINAKTLAAIGSCQSIRFLLLDDCSENKPEDFKLISGLRNLEELNLSGTNITDDQIATYNKFTNLRTLSLSKCESITGSTLKSLQSSKRLSVINFAKSGLKPENLIQLANLPVRSLDLTSTPVGNKDLNALNSMPLSSLNLDHALITDKGILQLSKNLRTLEEINLNSCYKITAKSLVYLKDLPNLKGLAINHSGITGDQLKSLSEFKKLKSLNLGRLSLTDEQIKPVTRLPLVNLVLAHNPDLTDNILIDLARMKTLKTLTLSGCDRITNQGVVQFKKSRPECHVSMNSGLFKNQKNQFFDQFVDPN